MQAIQTRLKMVILISLATCLAGCLPSSQAKPTSRPVSRMHTPTRNLSFLNQDKALRELLPKKFDPTKISLLVEKTHYRLTVYYALQPIKSYPMVLGPDPVSDKRREGDGATPEGVFHIRSLYPHNKWSKFMWIDYPTAESWALHKAAKAAGEIPADSTIGGEIGLHGVPNQQNQLIYQRKNWTAGCVSLTNPDIDELYSVSSVGMPVEILH